MNKTAVIHIGSGKTGSTTIQKTLFSNKKNNDNIIFYPTLLEHKTNQIFRFAFCNLEKTPSNIRIKYKDNNKGYLSYQNEILSDFRNKIKNRDNILISSEFLFLSDTEEVKRIHQELTNCGFNKIIIIAYLRDPADYYLSVSQQALKTRSAIPHPCEFSYDILTSINNWLSISPDDFILQKFSRNHLYNNDVNSDFSEKLKKIGFPISLEITNSSNETMTAEQTIALQQFQELIQSRNMEVTERLNFLEITKKYSTLKLPGTKPSLKDNIRAMIYENHSVQVEKINEKFPETFSFEIKKQTNNTNKENLTRKKDFKFIDIIQEFHISHYIESINILSKVYNNEKN